MKIKIFSRGVFFALSFLAVILVVTIILYSVYPQNKVTGLATLDGNEALAKCLTEKGVSMGGTSWCPHCQNQKEMFGTAFQYIDYHDCEAEPEWCDSHGITGYPTWVINNKNYSGEKTLKQLKDLANC